jgi:putative SOS response-associated peptidase YedK
LTQLTDKTLRHERPWSCDQRQASIGVRHGISRPYDPALMEAYAVNRAVNSVKNDTEECIEPVVV